MDSETKHIYWAVVLILSAIIAMIGQCSISDHQLEMEVERACMSRHCERGAIRYRTAYCGCEAVEAPQ